MKSMALLQTQFNTLHELLPDTVNHFELQGFNPTDNNAVITEIINIYKISSNLNFSFGIRYLNEQEIIEAGILNREKEEDKRYVMKQYDFNSFEVKFKLFNKKLKLFHNIRNSSKSNLINTQENIIAVFENIFLYNNKTNGMTK
jgi:hypothetical protein